MAIAPTDLRVKGTASLPSHPKPGCLGLLLPRTGIGRGGIMTLVPPHVPRRSCSAADGRGVGVLCISTSDQRVGTDNSWLAILRASVQTDIAKVVIEPQRGTGRSARTP